MTWMSVVGIVSAQLPWAVLQNASSPPSPSKSVHSKPSASVQGHASSSPAVHASNASWHEIGSPPPSGMNSWIGARKHDSGLFGSSAFAHVFSAPGASEHGSLQLSESKFTPPVSFAEMPV